MRLAGNGWTVIENNEDSEAAPPRLIQIVEDWGARFS